MLVHPHSGGRNARNDNMIVAERTIADISCGTMSGTPAGQAAQQEYLKAQGGGEALRSQLNPLGQPTGM